MTLPPSVVRRSRILSASTYALLLAITAVGAVRLVPFSIDAGQEMFFDPQGHEELVTWWRGAAVFGYTSGAWVGQLCALVAGLLVGQWIVFRTSRAGLSVAMLVGAGFGVTNLALAAWAATPRLHELANAANQSATIEVENGPRAIDPGLAHHPCVYAAAAVAFTLFLIAACVGFGVSHAAPTVRRVLLILAFVLVPIAYFIVNLALI